MAKTEQEGMTQTARLLKLSQLVDDWDAEAKALYDARQAGLNRGPITGFKKLDNELGGSFAVGIHNIHGTPGSGKTAFGLQVASTCECPALFITCEMSPIELLRRITARVTGAYLGRFKSGEMPPEESKALVHRAIEETPQISLLDATQGVANIDDISRAVIATRKLNPTSPHMLIVLDSLHSWADRVAPEYMEYDRLNYGLDSLRKLSLQLQTPILCICERNRQSMSGGGLSAGAGTRKIEYSGESVIDLEVPKDRTEDPYGNTSVTLTLSKNRHGAPGKSINLNFNGATQTFREI